MPESIFQRHLREAIGRSGLTQAEIAAAVGCDQSDISRYLKGRIPSGEKLVKLATALGTTAETLLLGAALMHDLGHMRQSMGSMVRDELEGQPDQIDWKSRALAAERRLSDFKSELAAILKKF
jgi:transcriptional regulator with XRE-family HTH domain